MAIVKTPNTQVNFKLRLDGNKTYLIIKNCGEEIEVPLGKEHTATEYNTIFKDFVSKIDAKLGTVKWI